MSTIVESKIIGRDVITLEQTGNLFLIRKNGKTLKMSSAKDGALDLYAAQIRVYEKGGEKDMGGKKPSIDPEEVADTIGDDTAVPALDEQEADLKAESELALIQQDTELAALYKQDAQLGSENLDGSAPYLRIHTATSTANELPDGSYPKDGQYFYAPNKQAFDTIEAHILTISAGFRIPRTDEKTGETKQQFNQLVSGVIVDNGELLPFIWYLNGLKLSPMWDFGKQIKEFTRKGIPMFAMLVELGTTQVKTEKYGMKWIPTFNLLVTQGNQPKLIHDVELYKMLKNEVIGMEERIKTLISSKASEDDADKVAIAPVEALLEPAPEDISFS